MIFKTDSKINKAVNEVDAFIRTFEDKKESFTEKLHRQFTIFIATLIFDYNWKWLDFVIAGLCTLEMYLKLLLGGAERRELVKKVRLDDVFPINPENTLAMQIIPKDSLYCETCPFQQSSSVASFFYGYQSSGFCYYLNKGDFSIDQHTYILWDGCKECGINEDILDSDMSSNPFEEETQHDK